jgi:hypothetical protein
MNHLTFNALLSIMAAMLSIILSPVVCVVATSSHRNTVVHPLSDMRPFKSHDQTHQDTYRNLSISQQCLDQLNGIISDQNLTAQLFSPNYFEASTYTEFCEVIFLVNYPKPVVVCQNSLVEGWEDSDTANYCISIGGQFTLWNIVSDLEYFRLEIENLPICTGAACNTAELASIMTDLYADIFPNHAEFFPLDDSTKSPTISPAPTSSACVRDMIRLWAHENISPLHNILNNVVHGSNCGFHGTPSSNGMASCDVSQWGDTNSYMKTYCINDYGGKYFEATLKGVSISNPLMSFEYKHSGLCIPSTCSDDAEAIDAAEDVLVSYSISSPEIILDSSDSSSSSHLTTTMGTCIISIFVGLGVIFLVG